MSLKATIAAEIAARGPMPFERFMELSLYHPEGFFGGSKLRSEKAGDFLTSPEVSPLFGRTLARFVATERARIGEPFQVVEVGAGSGSLLRPLLEEVRAPAVAVDVSPAARASLAASLPDVEISETIPDRVRGVVIANELLDNLPMALAQRVGGAWRERWVGLEGDDLVFVDAPVRPAVAGWLEQHATEVGDGGWVEVQLAAGEWVRDVLGRMQSGSLLIIDYGGTSEDLLPRRGDGTLRTYQSHHLGPHPLDFPGETDITADVEFSAIAAAARDAGAGVELVRQDDFLAGLGLREHLSELRAAELEAAREGDHDRRLRLRTVKTEIETLLHPRGLGGFMVMIAKMP